MNLDSFDKAAQVSARSFDHLSSRIDSQLAAAQQRHQKRLALLQKQYLEEQQQITGATTMKRRKKSQEWPLPVPGETQRQHRRRVSSNKGFPSIAFLFIGLVALAIYPPLGIFTLVLCLVFTRP